MSAIVFISVNIHQQMKTTSTTTTILTWKAKKKIEPISRSYVTTASRQQKIIWNTFKYCVERKHICHIIQWNRCTKNWSEQRQRRPQRRLHTKQCNTQKIGKPIINNICIVLYGMVWYMCVWVSGFKSQIKIHSWLLFRICILVSKWLNIDVYNTHIYTKKLSWWCDGPIASDEIK